MVIFCFLVGFILACICATGLLLEMLERESGPLARRSVRTSADRAASLLLVDPATLRLCPQPMLRHHKSIVVHDDKAGETLPA